MLNLRNALDNFKLTIDTTKYFLHEYQYVCWESSSKLPTILKCPLPELADDGNQTFKHLQPILAKGVNWLRKRVEDVELREVMQTWNSLWN